MSWRDSTTKWRARWGKSRIIQMLLGSRNAPLLKAGIDKIPTYGLLKTLGEVYVKALFLEMERAGLVVTVRKNEFTILLTLTRLGGSVMWNKTAYKMRWPELPIRPDSSET